MTKIIIGAKEYSAEELQAKLSAKYESQKVYHAKRNALVSKLLAFHKQYAGQCEELDAFMQ